MMIHITKEDIKMMEETRKWEYLGEDGYFHLKDDAPQEIKKHKEKMRKKRASLPD